MAGEERDGVTPFVKLHKIVFPSEMMVFADAEEPHSHGGSFWPILRDENVWKWRPWSWPRSLQAMTARHNGGCNMSFADGHVKMHRWKDRRTLMLIKGEIADANEASSANVDLDHMVTVLTR
jgi:prepilin-type processing-associated H-X9-DG protein